MYGLKLFWGVIFAGIFLYFTVSFARSVRKSRDIKYNWLRVVLAFLAVGLTLYVIFFVQP